MRTASFTASILRNIRMNFGLKIGAALVAMCLVAGELASAATIWTGATNNVWDVGTTANWTGGTGSVFTNGDDVVFNDAGANKSMVVNVAVAPNTLTFNNTAGNNYTYTTTAAIGGAGGTTITSNGTVIFAPSGAGPHSFGGGAIALNNAGSLFTFNPATAGASLTNNFTINATVTWDRSLNSGVRTGTATVNSNFTLRSDGVSGGVMDANMLLTAPRTIFGSRFGGAFPVISGNVNSSGGPHNITLRTDGDNTDWHMDVTTATGWNVKDVIHDAAGAQRASLLFLVGNESTFFSTMNANGGQLRLLQGGTKVGSDNTIDLTFKMAVLGAHRGFIDNNLINISGGGVLSGTGTLASKAGIGNDLNVIYQSNMNVAANAGGTISPGDSQAVNTAGILTINGDLAFSGGTLQIDVRGPNAVAGTDYDRLVVQDAPAVGSHGQVSGISTANLVVDFHSLSFDVLDGDLLRILTSSLTNFTGQQFASVTTLNTGDYLVNVVYGSGFIDLVLVSTIPEPSTFALLGLGVIGMAVRARRRRANG